MLRHHIGHTVAAMTHLRSTTATIPQAAALPAAGCRQSGFTIMEVMMAAIVMAFAITTSITTMQRGFLALDTARNTTIAAQIMQSELEKMRMKDWATVNAYAAGSTAVAVDASFTSNSYIGSRFSLTRTATDIVAGELRSCVLTVTWKNFDGRTLTRQFTTYYGRNGLYDYFSNQY